MKKILIIEDEQPIAELLKYGIEQEGMQVCIALTGKEGLSALEVEKPDVVLLDLMLPDMDGLAICRQATRERNVPIIILSARSDQVDKLLGLEYGADDYITKPFDLREVVLRIKSVLRRISLTQKESETGETLTCGDLVINQAKHEVRKAGKRIDLTPKEFALLEIMTRNKGKVFSRGELLKKVWEFEYLGDTRTVDIHIQRLRRKLGDDKAIVTVFGVGYKVAEDDAV